MTTAAARMPSHEAQLALQLFSELGPTTSIAKSPTDVGFNINQLLVDVKDLSLLGRKALLGCYFLASTSPPGNAAGAFDFDLGFFKWLINFSSSNNLAHLKKVLTEAQKSAIQVNIIDPDKPKKDRWVSVPLLGPVGIQGGRIAFKLPTELLAELSNPAGILMYLSLRIQANFTSVYAQTLFAKVMPLKDDGCTPWITLAEFAVMMNVSQYKWAKEYRYLNRDVICVAVEQINEHANIKLTLETKTARGSRRIEYIRFLIEPKSGAESSVDSLNGVISEQEIYRVLTEEFVMAPKDLDKVMANRDRWSNAKLLDAIAYTRARMADANLDQLRRPANYFLNALENGYRIVPPAKKKAEAADTAFEKKRRAKVQDDEKAAAKARIKALMAQYADLDAETQNVLWGKYSRSSYGRVTIKSVQQQENDGEAMERDALLAVARVRSGLAALVEAHLQAATA